ncbi:MAG: radical SAM family heme chaperone HemW [Candidatus Ventricola sp.]
MEAISMYIHVPLCIKKCAYCDFASFAGRMAQRERYVRAVCRELRAQAAFFGRRRVGTVFLGGGTPTLLTGEQVQALLDAVREGFDLAPDAEISMEGNPGTLTMEQLRAYRAAGVSRLSLGVQSLQDDLLAALGRIHTAAEAAQAVRMAREAGFDNLNLDLMLGLPGQTPAQWRDTLSRAIDLAPEHLSCYALILEEGTPLAASVQAGACEPLPDEDALEEMDAVTEALTRAGGYARYEVSNYARPGRECRHNLVYWECLPYLGVGLGAHSDMDGERFYNPADWEAYLRLAESGGAARSREGTGARGEQQFERMMMGLRMTRGVDCARFARDFGAQPEDVWPETIRRMTRGGLMTRREDRLRLTPRGMQVMNGVLVQLMEERA